MLVLGKIILSVRMPWIKNSIWPPKSTLNFVLQSSSLAYQGFHGEPDEFSQDGTDRNKNSVSHVWHHIRWNRQELGGTQVEHTCSIKIGGTKWNKHFIPNIPLPSFLWRPVAAASDDLLLPPPATFYLRRPSLWPDLVVVDLWHVLCCFVLTMTFLSLTCCFVLTS